jgi:hypothetical protein
MGLKTILHTAFRCGNPTDPMRSIVLLLLDLTETPLKNILRLAARQALRAGAAYGPAFVPGIALRNLLPKTTAMILACILA